MIILLSAPVWAGTSVGTYGRVIADTDTRGGAGEAASVVTYGSRLEKDPYVEVDLKIDEELDEGPDFRIVVTPALEGDLFHYGGEWDASLALRNLYAEATEDGSPWTAWVGSRMLRGDDVHLFDFWPLDGLNTVGGGASWAPDDRWTASAHVGVSRYAGEAWQVQLRPSPVAGGVGTEDIAILDRQRIVPSLKLGRTAGGSVTFRAQAYGELHALPAGEREVDQQLTQELPSDLGTVAGVQLSLWGWADDSFAHLWLKRATGLAAFGTTGVPGGLATDYTATGATEHLVALSSNHEAGAASVLYGAYLRRFEDADANTVDVDDRWEANVAIRPAVYVGQHVSLGAEVSQQWLRPDGLNPRTDTHDVPAITKLALLPALQPGRSSFSRPQLRAQYVYSYLNNDARSWFADDDLRHASNHQHTIGIGAEWWLNSESYR